MAKRKATVLEELERVRLIGPTLAEDLYSKHEIRSLDDLIKFGQAGNLTELKGVGKTKAETIMSSARRMAKANGDAREPAKTKTKAKATKKKAPAKKKTAKKLEAKKVEAKTKEAAKEKAAPKKKVAPKKKEAKKVEAKKETPTKKVSPRANGRAPEEPPRREAPEPPRASAGASAQLGAGAGSTPPTPETTGNGAAAKRATPRPTAAPAQLRERFIAALRCPACGHDKFDVDSTTLTCQACQRQFNLQNGIADLAPPSVPSRSMTQKLMESRFYAQFYEEFMRPRLTGVVSDRSMREEYRLAADFLDFGENTRLLDVGCGTGNFTRYFAQRIGLAETSATSGDLPLVVGMDISWPMLENARRNIRQENLDGKVFLLRGDATRIPVRRGAFNRLHCAGTLHLTSDIDESLRNFARVLERDGVCVIGTFILGKGMMRRMVKRVAEFPTRFHWFSRDELHKRIERAGFEILDDSVAGDAITVKARRI